MPFKSVMAVLGGDDTAKDLDRAIELASEIDAHLSVVALQVAMAPTLGDYPVDTDWLDRRRAHQRAFRDRAESDRHICNASDVPSDFSSFYDEAGFLTEEITRRVFYTDIVVAGPQVMKERDLVRIIVDGALFDAMRPVLLLPAEGLGTLRPKRVLVGWNGRIEAVRAVRESLDLLKEADMVHLTMVDPESPYGENDGEPGAEMAAYLARHGVAVTIDQLPGGSRDVADILDQHARDTSADMVVLGAYGHSRLRQRVFGGVTSSVLKAVRLPTLLVR